MCSAWWVVVWQAYVFCAEWYICAVCCVSVCVLWCVFVLWFVCVCVDELVLCVLVECCVYGMCRWFVSMLCYWTEVCRGVNMSGGAFLTLSSDLCYFSSPCSSAYISEGGLSWGTFLKLHISAYSSSSQHRSWPLCLAPIFMLSVLEKGPVLQFPSRKCPW